MDAKSEQLGMPFGTASGRLRKMILFDLLKRHGENICYRCGEMIDGCNDLSIEHKKAWLHVAPELFWDLDNIAFSHLSCNSGDHRTRDRVLVHGTITGYSYDCRCDRCVSAMRKDNRERMRRGRVLDKNYGR